MLKCIPVRIEVNELGCIITGTTEKQNYNKIYFLIALKSNAKFEFSYNLNTSAQVLSFA